MPPPFPTLHHTTPPTKLTVTACLPKATPNQNTCLIWVRSANTRATSLEDRTVKFLKTFTLGTTLLLSSGWLAAQTWPNANGRFDYQHDRDDRAAYNAGFQQGRNDAASRRARHPHGAEHYRERDDREAFNQGYNRGYDSVRVGDRDRDRDHDRDDRGPGAYGNPGRNGGYANGSRAAQQFGYRDGLNDGRSDRQSGHSFRPTHDDNYKNASNGYSGGDRNQYKAAYRQAYEQGYQQGYNGRR